MSGDSIFSSCPAFLWRSRGQQFRFKTLERVPDVVPDVLANPQKIRRVFDAAIFRLPNFPQMSDGLARKGIAGKLDLNAARDKARLQVFETIRSEHPHSLLRCFCRIQA